MNKLLIAYSFVAGCFFTLGAFICVTWAQSNWRFSREWFWKCVILWGEGGLAAAQARFKRRTALRAKWAAKTCQEEQQVVKTTASEGVSAAGAVAGTTREE